MAPFLRIDNRVIIY